MDALIRGIVSRGLQATPVQADGGDSLAAGTRMGKYNELFDLTPLSYKQVLADEGSYFTVNNAQAGLATAAAPTSFSSTNPFLIVYNKASPGAAGLRVYFDYITLLVTAAGTNGTNVQFAVVTDNGNRYSSAGTNLTANIVSSNMDSGVTSQCQVYGGNLTATTATAAARTIVGQRYMSGAIPAIGDEYTLVFGSSTIQQQLSVSAIKKDINTAPPLIIGPNQSMLFFIWLAGQSGASSYAPEIGWAER